MNKLRLKYVILSIENSYYDKIQKGQIRSKTIWSARNFSAVGTRGNPQRVFNPNPNSSTNSNPNNNTNPNANPNHNTKTNSNPDPNPPSVDSI